MTIKYQLNEQSLIENQLYQASKSPTVKKQRRYVKWGITILYIGIGLYFISQDNWIFGGGIAIVGLLWLVIYPLYSRRRYKNYYRKFVAENQSGMINQETELVIEGDFILTKNTLSEAKINISAVAKLIELRDNVIIRLQGSSIIIPKKYITDFESLKILFESKGVQYVDDTKWVWK